MFLLPLQASSPMAWRPLGRACADRIYWFQPERSIGIGVHVPSMAACSEALRWSVSGNTLHVNLVSMTTTSWSTPPLGGLLSICVLFDIRASEHGGCGCIGWSIGDKKMNVSVIVKARKKKKSDVDVTSVFLKRKKERTLHLFFQRIAPHLEQLKKAGAQKKNAVWTQVQKHLHGSYFTCLNLIHSFNFRSDCFGWLSSN